VTLVRGDLEKIGEQAALLKEMDYVIHAAANWGAHENNLDHSLEFFRLIDPVRCQKVLYFSTASILGKDNRPVPEAETLGTHYIRGKYLFHKKLPELPIYPKVVTLFPTWVLGGDRTHPYSHALAGILAVKGWLRLIRFFTVDAQFHFIHARDIAALTGYLLRHGTKEKSYVLGNAPIAAGRLIREICAYFGVPVYFQLPLSVPLAILAARLTGHRLHPWDLYCFERRSFVYQTVNAASFGLPSHLSTIQEILKETCD
jgi:nucleoside-diphosphate-sugar epimerase